MGRAGSFDQRLNLSAGLLRGSGEEHAKRAGGASSRSHATIFSTNLLVLSRRGVYCLRWHSRLMYSYPRAIWPERLPSGPRAFTSKSLVRKNVGNSAGRKLDG